MENLVAKDIIVFKAMSKMIIDELSNLEIKINEICEKNAEVYYSTLSALKNSNSVLEIQKLSNTLDGQKSSLVYHFAVLEKIEEIIARNKTRLEYFNALIASEKIANFDVSKKQIIARLESQKIKVSDENLGLLDSSNKKVFYNDMILELTNGEFRLDNEQNYKVLSSCEEKEFNMIMDKYPKCLKTISGEELLDKKFKNAIIAQFVTISDSKLKNKKISEVNEFFGSPLDLSNTNLETIFEFVDKIKNLFNVRTKKYLLETYPNFEKDIENKLVCNEKDETLPYNLRKIEKVRNNDYDNTDQTDDDFMSDEFNDFLHELLGE